MMEALKLFIFVLSVLLAKGEHYNKNNRLVLASISSIIEEYFAKEVMTLDIIYFEGGNLPSSSEKWAENILKNKPKNLIITVKKEKISPEPLVVEKSTILFIDSVQDFEVISQNIYWQSDPKIRYKHLVYVPGLTESFINEKIKDGFEIDSVNFLMNETEKSIELVSSFMFTEEKCRENQLKAINIFSKETMKWNNSNFFPKKYQNLHNCILTVASNEGNGLFGKVFEALSDSFNFTIERRFFTRRVQDSPLETRSCDLIDAIIKDRYNDRYINSVALAMGTSVYMIPFGEPYTQLEKMILMFDEETWIGIISTFVVGIVTIQILNRLPRTVQDIVYGRNIRTPTITF